MKIPPSLLRRSTRVNLKVLFRVAVAGDERFRELALRQI